MKVLVLGGTKFIGPYAVQSLVARGYDVTVFHRGQSNSDQLPPVAHIHGDRADLAKMTPTFAKLQPDVVLDMFAYSQREGEELMRVFRGLTRRLVVISSCDVYRAFDRFNGTDPGLPDPIPLTEQSPLRDRLYNYRTDDMPATSRRYLDDKILMERAVRADPEGLPATILRLPMVYGPGDGQHRTEGYLRRMLDGRPAILLPASIENLKAMRSYVADVGEAIALCVEKPEAANKTFHVAENCLTEREWVQRIGRAAGWSGDIVAVPDEKMPEPYKKGDFPIQDLAIDSTKIRAELGYHEIVDTDEAMRQTVDWERENPRADAKKPDYDDEDAALSAV